MRRKQSRVKGKRTDSHVEDKRKVGRVGNPHRLPILQPHAAGIDLGAYEHWVAAPPDEDGNARVRVFGTTTPQLFELADWLEELGVRTVAMESTGVYWIPLFEILDSRGFEVFLVNARQVAHVPGRKTDFLDCQWLQLLHSCGLLRGSFRPADEICQWRALARERQMLNLEKTDWVRRMQKALDQMNIRLHHAVSDLTGVTGMAILRAIVAGERDPKVLAQLRDRRCRHSKARIAQYLTGHWREEHLFNLSQALRMSAVTLRKSDTALGAYYRRIARRKGASVAVFATARKLARILYRLLRYGQDYLDIGAEAYEARFAQRRLRRYSQTLKTMGYSVVPIQKEPLPA